MQEIVWATGETPLPANSTRDSWERLNGYPCVAVTSILQDKPASRYQRYLQRNFRTIKRTAKKFFRFDDSGTVSFALLMAEWVTQESSGFNKDHSESHVHCSGIYLDIPWVTFAEEDITQRDSTSKHL